MLLDECAFKEKEMIRNITEGLENFSDKESYEMRKKILTKKILLKNLSILVVFFFLREQFGWCLFEGAI